MWDSPAPWAGSGGCCGTVWGHCVCRGAVPWGIIPSLLAERLGRVRKAANRGWQCGRGSWGPLWELISHCCIYRSWCTQLWVLSWHVARPGTELAAVAVLGTAGLHGTGRRKHSLTCRQGRYSISRQDHISSLKPRQIEMAVDPSSIM